MWLLLTLVVLTSGDSDVQNGGNLLDRSKDMSLKVDNSLLAQKWTFNSMRADMHTMLEDIESALANVNGQEGVGCHPISTRTVDSIEQNG